MSSSASLASSVSEPGSRPGTISVGFEVTDLYPEKAGVHRYGVELLAALTQLSAPPQLLLLETFGGRSREELLRLNGLNLPDAGYVRGRPLPGLFAPNARKFTQLRRLRALNAIDRFTTTPLRNLIGRTPRTARWMFPRAVSKLDVCHWSHDAFFPLPGPASIVSVLDTIPLTAPEYCTKEFIEWDRKRLALIARHASRVIAISEHTRRDIVREVGIPEDRIDVTPLAAAPCFSPPTDRATQREILSSYGLQDGDYVLYLGTIEPRKNVVRLAEAFKIMVEAHPGLQTKLVLAGKRGWLVEDIDAGLERLGLGERLVMPGRVPLEHLPFLLNGARTFAYVSLYEGFGLPPLEAMACGAAVVASNTTSLPEVVGDAGLLVDPLNVRDIAAALTRVVLDDALQRTLVTRGISRAAEFSWAKTAELTVRAYHRALADKRGAALEASATR